MMMMMVMMTSVPIATRVCDFLSANILHGISRTVSDVELPYRGVLVKLSLLTGGTSLAIP